MRAHAHARSLVPWGSQRPSRTTSVPAARRLPAFAVMLQAPGREEEVIETFERMTAGRVPLLGGGSAHNMEGKPWKQISKVGTSGLTHEMPPSVSSNGVVMCLAWPSCETGTALANGYSMTQRRGVVTRAADNGRSVVEIDKRPARAVYEEWTDGRVTSDVIWKEGVASVQYRSTFMPLGEPRGSSGCARAIHPGNIFEHTGHLEVMANVQPGMELCLLSGSPETVISQISTSARSLIARQDRSKRKVLEKRRSLIMLPEEGSGGPQRQAPAGRAGGGDTSQGGQGQGGEQGAGRRRGVGLLEKVCIAAPTPCPPSPRPAHHPRSPSPRPAHPCTPPSLMPYTRCCPRPHSPSPQPSPALVTPVCTPLRTIALAR